MKITEISKVRYHVLSSAAQPSLILWVRALPRVGSLYLQHSPGSISGWWVALEGYVIRYFLSMCCAVPCRVVLANIMSCMHVHGNVVGTEVVVVVVVVVRWCIGTLPRWVACMKYGVHRHRHWHCYRYCIINQRIRMELSIQYLNVELP